MDIFSNIDWHPPTLNDNVHFISSAQFCENSTAFAMSHGYYEAPWAGGQDEEEVKQQGHQDPTVHASFGKFDPLHLKRKTIPGFKKGEVVVTHPPEPFPRFSSLTAFQQRRLLGLLLKFRNGVTNASQEEMKEVYQLRELQVLARPEQQEYVTFAMHVALKHREIYDVLDNQINDYVKESWKARLEAVNTYPQYYTPKDIFPCTGRDEDTHLKRLATVVELGSVPLLKILPPNTLFSVMKPSPKLMARYPPDPKVLKTAEPSIFKTPISKDTNAASLALANKAKIVMNSTALVTLINNIGGKYERDWMVPVVIKEHASWATGDSAVAQLIYIDKPFPPTSMTAVEKNKKYYKCASKYHFCMPSHPQAYKFKKRVAKKTKQDTEASPGKTAASEKESLKRTFSAITEPETNRSFSPDIMEDSCASFEDTIEDLESEDGLAICLGNEGSETSQFPLSSEAKEISENALSSQSKKLKGKTAVAQRTDPQPTESVLDNLLAKQAMMLKSDKPATRKRELANENSGADEVSVIREAPENYIQPLKEHNVAYALWELRDSKTCFRLVLRSTYEACLVKENKLVPFYIASKLDYQPWYGGERFSGYDVVKQYVKTYIHPGSHVRQVRIDPYTSKYIMTEQKDQAQLTREVVELVNGPIALSFWGRLLHIIKQLSGLAPGSYLLQHEAKSGPFLNLLEAKDNGTFDLRAAYKVDFSRTAPNLAAPFQIDPECITPVHRALNKPPCLFEPFENPSTRKQPFQGKKKKKKAARKQVVMKQKNVSS